MKKKFKVVYKIKGGLWSNGSNKPLVEYVEENSTPKMVPNSMCKGLGHLVKGKWSENPYITPITGDKVFTFKFKYNALYPSTAGALAAILLAAALVLPNISGNNADNSSFKINDNASVVNDDISFDGIEVKDENPIVTFFNNIVDTLFGNDESTNNDNNNNDDTTSGNLNAKYTITFVNEDGTKLLSSEVGYGDIPVYDGEIPTKAATAQYIYTFDGWDPEVVAVTGNATYKAKFTQETRSYTITWLNEDGSEIDKTTVAYGETPTHAIPANKTVDGILYSFAGWDKELVAVTGDATYKATFTVKTQYTITWKNYNGATLATDTVDAGVIPSHDMDDYDADGRKFLGWDEDPTPVTGDKTYTAVYLPVKGDTITLNDGYTDGSEYKVLKKNDDNGQVFLLRKKTIARSYSKYYEDAYSTAYSQYPSIIGTFTGDNFEFKGTKYAGSMIDGIIESWYQYQIPEGMKNAIVETSIKETLYMSEFSTYGYNPEYMPDDVVMPEENPDYIAASSQAASHLWKFGESGSYNRHAFALDIEDIYNYFEDNEIDRNDLLNELFSVESAVINQCYMIALRTSTTLLDSSAHFAVYTRPAGGPDGGCIDLGFDFQNYALFAAFNIELSNPGVEYSIVS